MKLAVGFRNHLGTALRVFNLADGSLAWEALPDVGSETDLYVRSLIGDVDGNVYVAGGYAPHEALGTSYTLRRISPSGHVDWATGTINIVGGARLLIIDSSLYAKSDGSANLFRVALSDGSITGSIGTGVAGGNLFLGPENSIVTYGKVGSDYRYLFYNYDLTAHSWGYAAQDFLFHIYDDWSALGRSGNLIEKYTDADNYSSLVWDFDHGATLYDSTIDASNNVYLAGAIGTGSKAIRKLNSSGVEQWSAGADGVINRFALADDGKVYFANLATSSTTTVVALDSDGTLLWDLDVGDAFCCALVNSPTAAEDRNPHFFSLLKPITSNSSHSLSFL